MTVIQVNYNITYKGENILKYMKSDRKMNAMLPSICSSYIISITLHYCEVKNLHPYTTQAKRFW